MVFLNTVYLVLELLMIAYMIYKIKNCKQISLKDTFIYPFVILLSIALGFTAKYAYVEFDNILLLVSSVLSDSVGLVALKINADLVKVLAESDIYMMITYVTLYGLSALALFSLTVSLVKAGVANFVRGRQFGKEITYVYGFSDDAKAYLENLSPEKRKLTCVVLESDHDQKYVDKKLVLDELKVHYKVLPYTEKSVYRLIKSNISKNKSQCFVSFFTSDAENYKFVLLAKQVLKKYDLYTEKLRFVVCSSESQSGFLKQLILGAEGKISVGDALGAEADALSEKDKKKVIKDESRGCVFAYNKYELLALRFASDNNFAKFMPRQYINDNCTLKDVDVNLYMFGFGSVNQALLKDILVINQFVTVKDGYLTPVRINVEVFDSNKEGERVYLSSGILNYDKAAFLKEKEEYFDLPEDYRSGVKFNYQQTVGDFSSVTRIVEKISRRALKKPQVNFVIVSMGEDSFNCNFAKRFSDQVSSVKNSHTKFFVRTKDSIRLDGDFVYFGDDKDVLSYDNIVGDKTFARAKKQNGLYKKIIKGGGAAADGGKDLKPALVREKEEANLRLAWSVLSEKEQLSNIFSVLSTGFKLALMGLEMEGLTAEKFFARYDPKGERLKPYVYSEKLSSPSKDFYLRDVLAFIEHERWNAFEMSLGVVPMKKSLMVEEGRFRNKSPSELHHACVTTAKGLNEYYDYVSALNKEYGFDASVDVICYDYDNMDGFDAHLDR